MKMSKKLGAKLNEILEGLERRTEIRASAIVSRDGLMMASALPKDVDEDAISAMSAGILSIGTRVGQVLKQGGVEEVTIKGEKGYTIAMGCGSRAVLIATAPEDTKIGMLYFEMKNSVGEALSFLD